MPAIKEHNSIQNTIPVIQNAAQKITTYNYHHNNGYDLYIHVDILCVRTWSFPITLDMKQKKKIMKLAYKAHYIIVYTELSNNCYIDIEPVMPSLSCSKGILLLAKIQYMAIHIPVRPREQHHAIIKQESDPKQFQSRAKKVGPANTFCETWIRLSPTSLIVDLIANDLLCVLLAMAYE